MFILAHTCFTVFIKTHEQRKMFCNTHKHYLLHIAYFISFQEKVLSSIISCISKMRIIYIPEEFFFHFTHVLTFRPLSKISSAFGPRTVQWTAIFSFLLIPKDLTVYLAETEAKFNNLEMYLLHLRSIIYTQQGFRFTSAIGH